VGVNVSAPLAVDGTGAIWTGSLDAKLSRTVPGDTSGTVSTITTLPGSIVDSPVILSNGDVVVGDQTGLLHRLSSAGASLWTTEPNLGAAVHAPLVLAGGSAMLLAPTAGGKLFALRSDGSEVWSAALESGKAIRPGNIHTPPGQTAPVSSTAYFASESGKLFAVIVDGQLDASAPWPKAFHDPRNTNHAGPQP
jgi:outer membrane protein assembly factor BamB